ncbi:MAG: ATP-binding protein [Candidatus Babeliaceae bacterium]|nr:ATP-binding protein [Candidatus Babeliaceae bacterium]
MPETVQRWIKSREFADPEIKTLIEKQILHIAYEHLGNFHNKLLLSLPPEQKAKGQLHLGNILYEKEKWPFGISKNELTQNMAIFGRSGAGKTNVSFQLLIQLLQNKIPFLFLDWKRTARHLIPHIKANINIYTAGRNLSEFVFNPFIVPPQIEPHVYLNHTIDALANAYTLGDGAKSILQKAILECYEQGNKSPLAADIIIEIDKIESNERSRGWKITAKRALESINLSGIARGASSQESMIGKLLNANTIIELDSLNQNVKEFLIPLLFFWVYQAKLKETAREKLSLVIFIEEAHHVLYQGSTRSKESTMEMLLRQCREIGIGTVIIDQQPSLLSSTALANTYTSICLNQKSPGDINKAASLSLVDNDDKKFFSMLPVGWGIVKLQDRWTRPFLVRFPLVNIKKGFVTDEILRNNLNDFGRTANILLQGNANNLDVVENCGLPDDTSLRLLKDVLNHPNDGVYIRYERLNLNPAIGHKIKEKLISRGLIGQQIVDLGKTRKALLRLTQRGERLIGKVQTYGNESIIHGYWKRFYTSRFSEAGYEVTEEAARNSGRVDLLATRADEVVAIEVETGKSDVVKNVKADLTMKYTKIVVIATDERAMKKVECELAKVDLLGIGRIEVALRDGYPVESNLDVGIA